MTLRSERISLLMSSFSDLSSAFYDKKVVCLILRFLHIEPLSIIYYILSLLEVIAFDVPAIFQTRFIFLNYHCQSLIVLICSVPRRLFKFLPYAYLHFDALNLYCVLEGFRFLMLSSNKIK